MYFSGLSRHRDNLPVLLGQNRPKVLPDDFRLLLALGRVPRLRSTLATSRAASIRGRSRRACQGASRQDPTCYEQVSLSRSATMRRT